MSKDVIYSFVIWTDNGSTLSKVDTQRQEEKYPMIKVLRGCILELSLYSVNSVLIIYRTGNMQLSQQMHIFSRHSHYLEISG